MSRLNRRGFFAALLPLGAAQASISALDPRPRPRGLISPFCPRCGGPCLLEREHDGNPDSVARLYTVTCPNRDYESGRPCGWTGVTTVTFPVPRG